MNMLKQFLMDGDGQFSSNRLVFLLGYFVFFALWIAQSIHDKKIAPIDNSVIYLLVVLTGGKVGQSITDNMQPPALKP
jgi:hypothetical protein